MQTNQLILNTNDMNQYKRAQVIMLPTRSNLEFPYIAQNVFNKQLTIVNSTFAINCELQPQHLYIISDDEIKEGDHVFNIKDNHYGGIINKYNLIDAKLLSYIKKIIATTNNSLTIDCIINKNKVYHLPQPSQQFITKYIESYNKGEVITDVLVEYELENINIHRFEDELKVNPKDNTITIKKLKDSWNRNEVIELINKHTFEFNGLNKSYSELNKWIEENL